MLRGDTVKYDSGAYAVFTEQGSAASQTTAAKVMDAIARLPGCSRQAADTVSAYTQVKMEDAPRLLKIQKSECPDKWIRLPPHKWPKSWAGIEDLVFLFERNLYGHPLAGLLRERQFEEVLLGLRWEKVPNWECPFVHRKQGLLLSVNVDDIKMAGRNQNMAPTWKKLVELLDLDESTSFLDHVCSRCTQRECKPNEAFLINIAKSSDHEIQLEQLKNCHGERNFTQKLSRGPTWKDMLKSA